MIRIIIMNLFLLTSAKGPSLFAIETDYGQLVHSKSPRNLRSALDRPFDLPFLLWQQWSGRHLRFDVRMGIVVHQLKIVVVKFKDRVHLWV